MVGTLLLACQGETRTVRVPVGPTEEQLDRLGAAVAAVNSSRSAALAGPDTITGAATALDGADEASATGQRALAADARRAARAAVAPAAAAIADLPQQTAGYRTALAELAGAAEPLEPQQQAALAEVTAAGEAEAAALAAFGQAAAGLWPSYAALNDVQSTWLDRASAGWYRTQREAAAAYVVLRKPVLPELERARAALAQADGARRPATERMRGALSAADRALEGLRAPAG